MSSYKEVDFSDLGVLITGLRMDRGLTMQELADRCPNSMGKQYIAQIESRITVPKLERLRDLCAGLDIPMSKLFSLLETINETRKKNKI